jgi:uncharacterized membrane protein
MPGIKLRAPEGRAWTLKEMIQGKPLGAPSHAMIIHFPVAFYIGAFVFDLLSRFGDFKAAPLAATWLIVGAFIATVGAVTTGLVDYFGMVPGSTKRKWATRHMLFQLAAFAFFVVNLILRYQDRYLQRAKISWIVLGGIGCAFLTVGQWLGGVLVYELGMRVSTAERGEAVRAQRETSGS